MKRIDKDELKQVQLHVMQAIHDFCEERGIVYSLACGTLLGAVRHKGYIPWDDDIDIYLARDQYERLVHEFPGEYKHVRLVSLERDISWSRAYAKAYDSRTVLHEPTTLKEELGVNIDVYPIDSVPDDESAWLAYNRKRRFLQHVYTLKLLVYDAKRGVFKNALWAASKIALSRFSSRRIALIIDRYSRVYNRGGYQRSFENVQGMLQKHPFPSSLLSDTIDMPFEGRMFRGMKAYDQYLTNAYGDYMSLPPEEKRISHHFFTAYWKKDDSNMP